MQSRMQLHQLTVDQIVVLLQESLVGRLAVQSPDGYPYVVPMHFVYFNGKIYLHGLPRGQKIDYIMQNPKVGFEVDEMIGLLAEGAEAGCDVNTAYKSVSLMGEAKIISDQPQKKEILERIVAKYTPELSRKSLPEKMIRATAVIEISIEGCTGKYYP